MISLLIAAAVAAAPTQATIRTNRQAFVSCLHDAAEAAGSQKVSADGFEAFVMERCQARVTAFKDALIGFDVSNGVARKAASSDAQLQVDDYLAGAKDNYQLRMEPRP